MNTAQDVKMFLWARYDPNDNLIYPNISNWDELLRATIANNSYAKLNKDEVLSILFGLIHRTRISEGLWESMHSGDITQKLLARLLELETKNS